jgi:hypothetical protein
MCAADKLQVLQEQLGLQDNAAAAAVMRRHPYLASQSTAAVQQPLQQLHQLADSSPLKLLKSKAAEVLRAKPWLLTLGGAAAADGPQRSLAGRLQLLQQLAEISDGWRLAVEALAGSSAEDVAAVICDKDFVKRVQWLLQQQPAQPPAKEEVSGLYGLIMMRSARFEMRYPGFIEQQTEGQAASAAPHEP